MLDLLSLSERDESAFFLRLPETFRLIPSLLKEA